MIVKSIPPESVIYGCFLFICVHLDNVCNNSVNIVKIILIYAL